MALFKKGNQLQLGKNLGNIFAQKHTVEDVLIVLTDVYVGLVTHSVKEIKSSKKMDEDNPNDQSYVEERYTEHTGYSTLEEGFLRNGFPATKLAEWAHTHKNNAEVSEAIALLRALRASTLITGGANGTIPASIAKFLLTAQLGITDREKEEDKELVLPIGAAVEYVEDEEGGDFSYD